MTYKYITQEIVRSGRIETTSPEMYREAEAYNLRMKEMRRKKDRVDAAFRGWCAIQFILLGICNFYLPMDNDTDFLSPLQTAATCAYILLFIIFILIKKDRRPLTALLISVPLPVITLKLIAIAAANFALAYLYTRFYDEAFAELGYPGFATLVIT